jgi:hypothetical protein
MTSSICLTCRFGQFLSTSGRSCGEPMGPHRQLDMVTLAREAWISHQSFGQHVGLLQIQDCYRPAASVETGDRKKDS